TGDWSSDVCSADPADDPHILGPRPEPTRNEHARLDRETHSPHQPTSIAAVEIRRLVDVQPDAMPETVAEPFAVAAVGDHLAGQSVDVLRGPLALWQRLHLRRPRRR